MSSSDRVIDPPLEDLDSLPTKQEVYQLYCPSLEVGRGFGVITAGVIFTTSSREDMQRVFGEQYRSDLMYNQNVLVCHDDLVSCQIERVFPLFNRKNSSMSELIAKQLRYWLIEPEFSAEQRRPIDLDKEQRVLVTTRTESGYRRIRGSAGSGKSFVLAARAAEAAELAQQGKKVLVVTYNITLLNYLRDLAVRWSFSKGFRFINNKYRKQVFLCQFYFACLYHFIGYRWNYSHASNSISGIGPVTLVSI